MIMAKILVLIGIFSAVYNWWDNSWMADWRERPLSAIFGLVVVPLITASLCGFFYGLWWLFILN